jgi:hypothetical protein
MLDTVFAACRAPPAGENETKWTFHQRHSIGLEREEFIER